LGFQLGVRLGWHDGDGENLEVAGVTFLFTSRVREIHRVKWDEDC
jgi:hypothetical protein